MSECDIALSHLRSRLETAYAGLDIYANKEVVRCETMVQFTTTGEIENWTGRDCETIALSEPAFLPALVFGLFFLVLGSPAARPVLRSRLSRLRSRRGSNLK